MFSLFYIILTYLQKYNFSSNEKSDILKMYK